MSDDLPVGYTWRRPTVEDAEAIFALVSERNTGIIGFADFTLDDTRDHLTEPGFDPGADGWLVADPGGAVVGFGWSCRKLTSAMVDIDVTALDDDTAAWLFSRMLDHASELADEIGHDEVQVDMGIYRADESQRTRATALGFTTATTFHRMRIDHEGVPPAPPVADGVVVRIGPGDDAFRRDAHMVLVASFADHFGFAASSFDQWHERIEASATHDWAQLRVVYIDAEPVAMLLGNDAFVEDEGCGYVADVGVLPAARGRGLARMLLRQAFAEDARRGRKGTLLHVDTNNPTPALDLYLSVGMRAVLVVDLWRRALARQRG
jgi:mycothiol synthase